MIFGQTLRAAAVLLHGHLFAQRSAAAHLHRALDLRLAEAGVDGLTDIVHGEIVEHLFGKLCKRKKRLVLPRTANVAVV